MFVFSIIIAVNMTPAICGSDIMACGSGSGGHVMAAKNIFHELVFYELDEGS